MTTFHSLTPTHFAGVAGGGGGPEAIRALHTAQVSKHLLLIGHLLGHWPASLPGRDTVAHTLERARQAAPGEVHEVIGAPLVGSWSGIAARAVAHGSAAPVDFLHLGALAVVACAAAGIDGSVVGSKPNSGALLLPTGIMPAASRRFE